MARGWESKSVEQQQDEASSAPSLPKPRLTADELARLRRRQGLLLSRQRVLQQLQNASEPRYREMLEAALADLDLQLSQLG